MRSLPRYFPLDGKLFAAPRDAERAAYAQLGRKSRPKVKERFRPPDAIDLFLS